jgi:hypothetical protein
MKMSQQVANTLARLCTYNNRKLKKGKAVADLKRADKLMPLLWQN